MTKKQKKVLYRIIIVLILFVLLLFADKTGTIDKTGLPGWGIFVLYMIPYLIIGYDIIIKAAKNIRNGQVFDENFLMMVATFAAFGTGEYSEALAVMLFYQIGELFQGVAVGRSRRSISAMMEIAPEYANLETDGHIEEVDPDDVEVGSIIVVKPGEKIPLDGKIISGESFLNTAALTGEAVPRRVHTGDDVVSGCLNGEGTLRVETSKAYEDSTVARILELVENASSRKARLENFITRFAKYYNPVVTIGAALLAVIPQIILIMQGAGSREVWYDWIQRACTFLIVSCPCALVISVPLGFFGGIGASSRIGVLVKGSNFLEALAQMDTVVFDKTGTLTKGEFKVSRISPASGFDENNLLEMAAYVESCSSHPIARSVTEAYGQDIDVSRVSDVSEIAGHGILARFDSRNVLVGNDKLMKKQVIVYDEVQDEGATVVYVACDGKFAGSILISDTIKDGAAEAIRSMKAAGVSKTVMLTGDHAVTADKVAREVGIDEVHAELLPADKVSQVEKILARHEGDQNKTGFVGDGINDAPVLMRADVGIAMGALGSDAAIEAADVVLMDDDIRKIAVVKKIAVKTMRIVKENITFALGVKILVLALGALGFANMWMAVFADVGVSVIAIINSMRTLRA